MSGSEQADGPIEVRMSRKTRPEVYPTLLQNPNAERVLADFHWHEYMRANHDLDFPDAQHARWHLEYDGHREKRLFDLDRVQHFDQVYYRARYPEHRPESDAEAQMHYSYIGYYEARIPNADTEWVCSTDLYIVQHGKVGSYAIVVAHEGRHEGGVLHMHWPTDIPLNYPACALTNARIVARARVRSLKVVSACREVLSRVISGARQYLDTVARNDGFELALERLIAYLEDAFLHDCDVVTSWFDHRFNCGLDIYAHRFDHERGDVHLRNGVIDLFLYRQEDLGRIERPLAEFLGLPDFRLGRHNTAESKGYQEVYHELMTRFVVPWPIIEKLYAAPHMRFFYTEDERARLLEHWTRPRDAHVSRASPCRESRQ